MTACPHCTAGSAIHDLTRTCCRARYLLALPSGERYRGTRRYWLDLWRREYGAAAADETQDAVAAAWAARKTEARERLAEARNRLATRTAA